MAGLLIGSYSLPTPSVRHINITKLLIGSGLELVLFGLGLEFSWGKMRQTELSFIVIGAMEILTVSSSAIIAETLWDIGKLDLLSSSRLIVDILVVEDFAAVAIIAVL